MYVVCKQVKAASLWNKSLKILDDISINMTESCVYLGIQLDPELNFEATAANVFRKASHKIYNLYVIRKDVSVATAFTLFKSMVLPFFNYPNFLLNSCTETNKKNLQRPPNRGLKIAVKREYRVCTHDLHVDSRMMLLENQRKFDILKVMHFRVYWPICGNVSTAPVNTELSLAAPSTRMRSAPLIDTGTSHNTKYLKSLDFFGSQLWNALPPETRRIDDFSLFKASIRPQFLTL